MIPIFFRVMCVCTCTYDNDGAGEFSALHLPISLAYIFSTLAYGFHNKYYQ